MRLKNKKTGEMGIVSHFDNQSIVIYPIDENWNAKGDKKYVYASLAELNEEWCDAPEEPKEYWYIDPEGEVTSMHEEYEDEEDTKATKEIGNYFLSREEAECAVLKLKAWKRLKDKGFRFTSYGHYDDSGDESPAIAFEYPDLDEMFYNKQVVADLDLLFCTEVKND